MAKKRQGSLRLGLPYHSEIIQIGIEKNLSLYEVLLLHTLRASMRKGNTSNWRKHRTLAKEMGDAPESRFTELLKD